MLDAAKAALVGAIVIVVAVLVALIRIRDVARSRKLRRGGCLKSRVDHTHD